MQAIGLFFAAFFGMLSAAALLAAVTGWLYSSKYLAKVKIMILPGQEEQLEYTMRALRRLNTSGRLNIESILHKQPQGDQAEVP